MYEQYYYTMMTTAELENVVNNPHQYLEGYVKRCSQELDRRVEEEIDFLRLW